MRTDTCNKPHTLRDAVTGRNRNRKRPYMSVRLVTCQHTVGITRIATAPGTHVYGSSSAGVCAPSLSSTILWSGNYIGLYRYHPRLSNTILVDKTTHTAKHLIEAYQDQEAPTFTIQIGDLVDIVSGLRSQYVACSRQTASFPSLAALNN